MKLFLFLVGLVDKDKTNSLKSQGACGRASTHTQHVFFGFQGGVPPWKTLLGILKDHHIRSIRTVGKVP